MLTHASAQPQPKHLTCHCTCQRCSTRHPAPSRAPGQQRQQILQAANAQRKGEPAAAHRHHGLQTRGDALGGEGGGGGVLRRHRELDDFMGCDSVYCACHHSSLSSAFLCFGHCKIVTIGARTAQPQIRNKGIVPAFNLPNRSST